MRKPLFPIRAARSRATGPLGAPGSDAREAIRLAELAAQLEELFDQVWRCERQWELDDRIAFACRRHRHT